MATKTKKTETATATKTFKMTEVFALWKRKSKKGADYFTGKGKDYPNVVAFYNKNKKNPKEADLRVYNVDSEGNIAEKEMCSLWVNVSKNKNKFLSGKVFGKRVVGFIRKDEDEKKPYINVYYQEENQEAEGQTAIEEVAEEELPF